ncbi:AAA family ATPase [Oceanibacterium hippocampi]|uniref:Adenylyl-sulfate kinase n=1 Tax=Oceanibacterium hippocampi TaxID=745714 RepID=A0A1Y5RC54_9PROT|nr:AAA family ATPase [Oceanibacterium hippocampi]SLN13200.1 Adenylyl-sulfate kinase [Oceanibacterium hippocampi]
MPSLIAFSGLPGVGKSTIARALSERIQAVYVRVDAVEAALKASVLIIHPAEDAGYRAAAAVARDNLTIGLDVVADTVNPVRETRALWAAIAAEAGARLVNVEVVCSDAGEHRRRVESRKSDIAGLSLPDWDAVQGRRFEPWMGDRLTLDTTELPIADCIARITDYIASRT